MLLMDEDASGDSPSNSGVFPCSTTSPLLATVLLERCSFVEAVPPPYFAATCISPVPWVVIRESSRSVLRYVVVCVRESMLGERCPKRTKMDPTVSKAKRLQPVFPNDDRSLCFPLILPVDLDSLTNDDGLLLVLVGTLMMQVD